MLIERPVAAHQARRRGKCRERIREETMEVLGKHTSGKIKTGAAKFCRAPEIHIHELVAIVIVLIPIAFAMPAVAVFVPPAVPLMPAVFPRFMQFMPRTIRWSAVPAVMLHGFVQSVVRLGDAPLATVVAFGGRPRCSRECQHAEKRR